MRCKNIFLNFFTLIKKVLIAYQDFYFDLDLKASNYSNNLIFVPIFEQTYSGKPVQFRIQRVGETCRYNPSNQSSNKIIAAKFNGRQQEH